MRVNLARCFATLMGLTVVTTSFADFGQNSSGNYVPPSKWSHFNASDVNNASAPLKTSRPNANENELPRSKSLAPQARYGTSTPQDIGDSRLLSPNSRRVRPVSGNGVDEKVQTEQLSTPQGLMEEHFEDGYSETAPSPMQMQPSPLSEALSAPWSDCDPAPPTFACGPVRKPLCPWFAGSDLLFWNMADTGYQRFTLQNGSPTTTHLNTNDISPDSAVGYDLYFGRYLDCGRYGLSVNYLNFNPDLEHSVAQTPVIGDYYAAMPHWNQISIDRDGAGPGAAESVYGIFDDAAAHRVCRDVSIQGIELNLSSFGIMGARRIAPASCGNGGSCGCGPLSGLKRCLGLGCGHGYTSAGGLLERPCTGCAQVIMTQGFRWFQFNDEFQFASTDAYDGYSGPTDVFYDANVQNNLYGYQFGGRLVYCLAPCLTANIGGKAGVYGNDVQVDQRIGTFSQDAYVTSDNSQRINTHVRDTVLSGLGEIDCGLGYRLGRAWTLNGGYRLLYATGVATSIGAIPNEYFSVGPSTQSYANDSLMLHGAYVGAAYNW